MSIIVEKQGNGVAVVSIDRPQVLNALDVPAKEALGGAWADLSADPQVRAIVLTGRGRKAFCAGSDIKEINRTGKMVSTETLLRAIPGVGHRLDKPVIAALHGYTIGMGMTLALHCDLRIAGPDTVLGYPEVKHGMISAVSAMRLKEVIPDAYAMQMLLMAKNLTVEEAQRFGLINAVAADPLAEAMRWAETIAGYPAVGVQATKRLARMPRSTDPVRFTADIEAVREWVESYDDFKQGAAAFERR